MRSGRRCVSSPSASTGGDQLGEVFEGTSPHADLLTGHLDRMSRENRETIQRAIEEDDESDPTTPDPEV